MKKALSVLMVFLMLIVPFTMAVSAENFVPSADYKPAPGTDDTSVIITPVSEADDTTEIPSDVANELIDLFEQLSDEDFDLSDLCDELNDLVADVLGDQYDADSLVIRDFFNVYSDDENVQSGEITFDVDVDGKPVFVVTYYDGKWNTTEVTDNGDGTITVDFEKFGHVAILVPADGYENAPQTGDDSNNVVWFVVMFVALAAITALVVANRSSLKTNKAN